MLLLLNTLVLSFIVLLPRANAALVHVSPKGVDASICGTLAFPCASFRFALQNIARSSDTIELAAGEYVDSGPTLEFGLSTGLRNIIITAAGSTTTRTPVTIDRAYSGRLFTFTAGAGEIRIVGIRFLRGGWQDVDGSKDYSGALMQFAATSDADIEFMNCIFEACKNPNKGYGGRGGVGTIAAGSPRFTSCLFTANWAGVASAFHISGTSSPMFDLCTFENSGCYEGGWGGVVVPEDQSAGVWKNSVFRNNSCDYGGAVDDGGTAIPLFVNCSFESNFGGTLGGAYYGFGNTQTKFTGCRFFGNRVGKGGVGQDYYLSSSVITTFENTLFDTGPNPVLISDGASGAAKDNSSIAMTGCTLRGYRAALGVIMFSIDSRGSIENSLFTENECVKGGAIMASNKPVFVRNCTFLNNVANDGGAIYFQAASVSENSILDSHFEGNVAKSTGGAIRLTGQMTVTMSGCTFKSNSAKGTGGGAIYLASDATLSVNNSIFEDNTASSGGAIWAEGTLAVTRSAFRRNLLLVDEENAGDACGAAAGVGGAIYSSLASTLPLDGATTADASTAATGCKMEQLQLDTLTFEQNNASTGGGGGIFLDQHVPSCVNTTERVCRGCTFTDNDAAYGENVATIVSKLELHTKVLPLKWTLMAGNDVAIGAIDLLGQALQGQHAPLVVRVKLLERTENGVANASSSLSSVVSLTSNATRTIRSGEASFKALSLHMAAGETTSKVDRSLTLSFTSDTGVTHTSSSDSTVMTLLVPITLEKCAQDNGLLNTDGSCLVEASGGTDRVVAGIIFSVAVGGAFMFVLYWSYKNSNRVMRTIQQLVTGVGSIVIKFFFELLDIASDVQALINLFLFDVSLSHPTFVRVTYVTCFALSILPSAFLVQATLQNIVAQWKRTKMRKIFVRRNRIGATENSMLSQREDTSESALPSAREGDGANDTRGGTKVAFETEMDSKTVLANGNDEAANLASSSSKQSTRKLIDAYIKREIEVCEQELEYYRTRATLMKRVLARLVTEDLLLLILNLYIYLANHSDETFLSSRFRSSLEFSIFTSAISFGSQLQTIVTWLQLNKVGEISKNLRTLKQLKARVENSAKQLEIPPPAKPWGVISPATVSPVKKALSVKPHPGQVEHE